MKPILSSYAWPVFDRDGRLVALFAVDREAKAWAQSKPWVCLCEFHTAGPACSYCGGLFADRTAGHKVGPMMAVTAKEYLGTVTKGSGT